MELPSTEQAAYREDLDEYGEKEDNEAYLKDDAYVDWMRAEAFKRKGAHGERLIWEYATLYYPRTRSNLEKNDSRFSAQLENMELDDLLPIHTFARFLPNPLTVYRQQYDGVSRNDLRMEEPNLYFLLQKIGALHKIPEQGTATGSRIETANATMATGLRWADAVAPSDIVREYRYGIQLIMKNSPQEARQRIEALMHFAMRERKIPRNQHEHFLVTWHKRGWSPPLIQNLQQDAGPSVEEDFGHGTVAVRERAFESLIREREETDIQSQPAGLTDILRSKE